MTGRVGCLGRRRGLLMLFRFVEHGVDALQTIMRHLPNRPRSKGYERQHDYSTAAYLRGATRLSGWRTGITGYRDNGGNIENAQAIAAHESPRATELYDRTSDELALDEVEKIII